MALIDVDDARHWRVSLRPAPEPADRAGLSSLGAAEAPLARRRRRRSRLSAWLAGSGTAHLIAVMLLLTVAPSGPPPSHEPPSVEMIFGHNGSAGLQGPSVPQEEQGAVPPAAAAPPEPLPSPPVAPPAAAPEPTPAPAPIVPPVTPRPEARVRPRREMHRQARSSNPFANLTNLSLEPMDAAPTPEFHKRGRGGSGSDISLSLGPMIRGGHFNMPFSMSGGHGMTSDYRELLDDWVNRHKFYPQSAADRGHDGQVAIHVEWNRDGRVLNVHLIYGSGDEDLDDAWVSIFRGAHLPPPPPDVPGDPIRYDMIMNYELLH